MARLLPSIISLCFHYVIVTTVFISIPRLTHSSTLEADTQILRALKHSIDPSSISPISYLNSWDFSVDPCEGSLAQFQPLSLDSENLTYLSLSNNEFAGPIPDLTGLWQLHTLDLSSNQFHGNLPNLPMRLRSLLLNHNILSGHISPVTRLTHLRKLDVSDNRLSETIDFFGEDTRLQVLDAEYNRLHGYLPVNLVTIRNLTTLNLAHNLFSGTIPREYGDKPGQSWRSLYLDNNFLSGNLPPKFISRRARLTGSLANNCLRCPTNIPLCRGGQRPGSECVGQNSGSR
uniref:Leucine-rich repeat-containing N-terminal plant-type domain-containing protein n=1 Tax=Fagus sylvatica TaxID=28930 RepID=A0A2N9IIH4_FAGSY